MLAFVTGGSGLIGTEVLKMLTLRGIAASSFDLVPPEQPLLGVNYYQGSILDPLALTDAMQYHDVVLHLAAMTGVEHCTKNAYDCVMTNALGTQCVIDAAIRNGIKHMLFTSSSEVYGRNCENVSEEADVSPMSEYAVAKLAGEEYVRAAEARFAMNNTVVRFFNVYGPSQKPKFVMPKFANAILNGLPITIFGDGTQRRTYCYASDAARAVVDLVVHRYYGLYNIGSSEQVSLNELADLFFRIAGARPLINHVGFDQSDRNIRREVFVRSPSVSKLIDTIGFAPKVSLEQGVRSLLAGGLSGT